MVGDPSPFCAVVEQCVSDSKRWFPGAGVSLPHHVLALAGEVGELANLVKKVERGSHQMDAAMRRMMVDEATDVLIYLMNIYGFLGADPGKAYEQKRAFNEKRFGNGHGRA